MKVELSFKELSKESKKLIREFDEDEERTGYEKGENVSMGSHDLDDEVQKIEELYINNDGEFHFNGWFNNKIGIQFSHTQQLTDEELIKMYEAIKVYFSEKLGKINKMREISGVELTD